MNKYIKFLVDPFYRFSVLTSRGVYDDMSDEKFLRKKYKLAFKKDLDLENPKTFTDKLQWLKLYDRNPVYTTMVDKYEAKNYVAGIIGKEHIIPTIAICDNFDDIDFGLLPEKFVLKCTHNSGGLVVCKNKSELNMEVARERLTNALNVNYYLRSREWPYKNVKPRIIVEKYMEECGGDDLIDYKFYCFNGEPKFLYISQGLANHATARINFVTLNWEKAEFKRDDFAEFETLPPKPLNFDKMIEFSKKLSQNIPFLRVDFYNIGGHIYFSELTFFPGAGFTPFNPNVWNYKIGEYIKLPR